MLIRTLSLLLLGGLVVGCDHRASASNEPAATRPATTQPSAEFPVKKTKEEWAQELPAMTCSVMFEGSTERPFHNEYWNHKAKGTYVSAATGAPLFRSDDKYDSGTGWPSFFRPVNDKAIIIRPDPDGSGRLEVLDASSNGHLGHVFDDGPAPTGKRYCMNSAALKFIPDQDEDK